MAQGRFIRITAALAAITCVSGVAAALSFDGGSHRAAVAATVSAGFASTPVGAAPLTSAAQTTPASDAPATTDAPTTVPATAPTAPSSTSTPAATSTVVTTTSTVATEGEIYGFVIVNGIPVPGATMMLNGPGGERRTQTDLRGHYLFEHLAPGEYDVIQYFVSTPTPCVPTAEVCLGPAQRLERHEVSLSPGESHRDDWSTDLRLA
jgi:hypothetical protein